MLLGAPPLAVVAMCCLLVSAHNQRQKMPAAAVDTMLLHHHIHSQPGIPLDNETNDSSIPAARIQISASVIAPVLSQLIVIHDDDDDWQLAGWRPWFLVQILRNALHCHREDKKAAHVAGFGAPNT